MTALDLRVTALRWLAPSIREIELAAPDGAALPQAGAGAHVDLALPGDLARSYSLVNGPGDGARYLLAVHRDSASRGGSAYICDALRPGTMLRVSPPRNSFPLVATQPGDPAVVFFAGGIGITPILAMIRERAAAGLPWVLHYALRARSEGAYLAVLTELAETSGGALHIHDDAQAGQVMDIAARLADVPEGAHLYCCGPAPMIAAFQQACQSRPPAQIHVEHFTNSFEASTNSFTLALKRKGIEIEVPAGMTIIDALVEAGVRVNYSCREGVCGTCETRVIAGIPDHKDNVLSDREKASNKLMMICCSGAKSDRLVLDL